MPEKRCILLVDDDREIVRGLSIRLRAKGFDIETAADGLAAWETLQRTRIDAMVLDVRMPGMDGLTLLDRLQEREDLRDIPVIVLSANVVEETRKRALALGARCFIAKPYKPAALLSAIVSVTGNCEEAGV